MTMCARAVALCCAFLVAVGSAAAYTVDCNHEYTDCDTELSKLTIDDDELPTLKSLTAEDISTPATTTTLPPQRTSPPPTQTNDNQQEETTTDTTYMLEIPATTEEIKPRARLLNLNVEELQNFAIALHNQTDKGDKRLGDISDVNLDDDDEEAPRMNDHLHSKIADKFYSNLQAPFHTLVGSNRESEEIEMCKENEVGYKIGEKIDRGCEETCECMPDGNFDCTPRCKHPYIRRGRQLNDPLCFESPVDECCSIIACSTGTDQKPTKIEICKTSNGTYPVGGTWHIGCETTCVCEGNSVVTCKPRCNPLPPSEKCINVQDPNDACCEVQVCDVSQDVHELPENITSTTSTTEASLSYQDFKERRPEQAGRSSSRPLVLAEPIGSIKVLQNNSVQVNLIHPNKSVDPIHLLLSNDGGRTFQDVELKYSNLILNLGPGKDYILKTKETGTKFNFTITSSDGTVNEVENHENVSKAGCWDDGRFYEIGAEFRIGCTELCECTGPDTHECVALVCPNHVGLEIMSKGCVKWAPSPPAQPPNCCPRSARCLSDGTCHYNGVPVPNWSEVPLSLTGCEKRCFCENGDLDCQEVCTPLPPVPPQTLRCPAMHRPAPVNISDEDCCKQWGCVPIGPIGIKNNSMAVLSKPINYVTLTPPVHLTATTQLPPPPPATYPVNFYKPNANKFFPKLVKTLTPIPLTKYIHDENLRSGDNITVFTLDDIENPFKIIRPEPPSDAANFWQSPNPITEKGSGFTTKPPRTSHVQPDPDWPINFILQTDNISNERAHESDEPCDQQKPVLSTSSETYRKPLSSPINAFNYFLPTQETKTQKGIIYHELLPQTKPMLIAPTTSYKSKFFFNPLVSNISQYILTKSDPTPSNSLLNFKPREQYTLLNSPRGKHVTLLKTTELGTPKPNEPYNVFWSPNPMTRGLKKTPTPSETVVLKAVPSPRAQSTALSSPKINNLQVPHVAYSSLELEHMLRQMEIESEVNRNLERSTDKKKGPAAGQYPQKHPDFPPHKPLSPFLPTVPPEIHFPSDDAPDYDQNNIHRPAPPGVGISGLPPGLQVPSSFGDLNKKLTVISIESDSPTSIKMLLGLPPVLVGLRGSVDLRYTDKADEDISHWYSQVFAPADEVLTTPRLEFRLTGLVPSSTYKVRGKLFLHNLPVSPESDTYSVRTQDAPQISPVEEKRKEIDSGLRIIDVNDTTAHATWRHFREDELQFIDGIQVRYRPVGTPIYIMTEMLHHGRSAAELHDLRPGSRYEASLVLIPPPRATTELHDPGRVEFTTMPYIDPYNWTVIIEVRSVGAEAAELTWRGVPSPAERWVRVYRAAHACGDNQAAGKEHDEFRLAARDQPPSVTLSGLEPDTRCRVWLELFLTNGKVKTSNVLEINTKSLDTDNPIDNEIEASSHSGSRSGSPRGDYYTALVGVGVVAALGALTSLLLLLVVVRRHRPRSVPITPVPTAPRESSLPPYDNPAYKLELQQETMDL